MGGYWIAIPGYHNASGTLVPQEAHNDYLELLASGGIIGALMDRFASCLQTNTDRSDLLVCSAGRELRSSAGDLGLGVHRLFDLV